MTFIVLPFKGKIEISFNGQSWIDIDTLVDLVYCTCQDDRGEETGPHHLLKCPLWAIVKTSKRESET